MRVRALLIGTALVSSILGATVAYLVLTVPNDIKANVLMKQARSELDAGHVDRAREALAKIVQQYPRTDAGASATVALVSIGDSERAKLQSEIGVLRREVAADKLRIGDVEVKVAQFAIGPPAPTPPAPPPDAKPAPKKPKVKKKAAPPKRKHR
jgi:hypothetical protein